MAPRLQQRPNMRLGGPGNQAMVGMRGQNKMHVHTSQDGQLERCNELLVGQEIRRGDPDRTPRQVDRGQKDQNQLIDLLVRPATIVRAADPRLASS